MKRTSKNRPEACSQRGRQGFTLIELLVILLVGMLLVGAVWTIFSSSTRHSRHIDERLGAIQAAQALVEVLRQDVAQAIVTPGHGLTASVSPDGSSALELTAADAVKPARFGNPCPGDREVRYRFDAAAHKVYRNDEPLPFAAFEKVDFRYVPASATDKYSTRDAAAIPNCVQYRITTASPTVIERTEGGLQPADDRRGRVTLAGSVRIASQTARAQFPGWTEHSFETPE